MRNRYVLEISKTGYIKYISHLDMMRLFKRLFKKAGIRLEYSQGFNPHPKMSFAQPLPLGYSSSCETLEFELKENSEPNVILNRINSVAPLGITAIKCEKLDAETKSFAARLCAASYEICIPVKHELLFNANAVCDNFLNRDTITAEKINKKSGSMKTIDISGMIRSVSAELIDNKIIMNTTLDAGGTSNLSPELLITAFISFAGIEVERDEIDVKRVGMSFK